MYDVCRYRVNISTEEETIDKESIVACKKNLEAIQSALGCIEERILARDKHVERLTEAIAKENGLSAGR